MKFVVSDVGPRGIVGVHHNDGARPMVYRLIKRGKINLPPVIVDQRIGHQFYVLKIGKETEQRITRLGDKNFVFGIAEKPKKKGIAFAGAGGEDDVLGIYLVGI